MAITVFAEGMGYFHKGSGGKGVAPGDVCLTPPPPPAGPLPVPYVNMLQASDLAKGSKTVKIDGSPTALENASHVSTSAGNEPATQGGGVVTHKTKGKGSFKLWSFTVKAEGKGVARHGDPMEQNTASPLPNCVDAAAITKLKKLVGAKWGTPCTQDWDKDTLYSPPTPDQYEAVKKGPCWECKAAEDAGGAPDPGVWDTAFKMSGGKRVLAGGHTVMVQHRKKRKLQGDPEKFTPDHQPPQSMAWTKGGCHLGETDFVKFMKDDSNVIPHCKKHSSQQGGVIGGWLRAN